MVCQVYVPGIMKTLNNRNHTIMVPLSRGDYDYCRVPGTQQLSPLEVGEDNSKFEPKNN